MNKVLVRFNNMKPPTKFQNQTIAVVVNSENKVEVVGNFLFSVLNELDKLGISDERQAFSIMDYYLNKEFGLGKVYYETQKYSFYDRIMFTVACDKKWRIAQLAIKPSPESYFSRKKRAAQKVSITEADKQWARKHGLDSLSFMKKSSGKKEIK